jgi:hypothetical protein
LDALANDTTFRWTHELAFGVIGVACAHNHSFRHDVRKLPWLQINEDHHKSFGHLGKRNELLETRTDQSEFSGLSDINSLNVKFFTAWMGSTLNNLSDTNIAVAVDIPNLFNSFYLRCGSGFCLC